jgi:hypothetical protein
MDNITVEALTKLESNIDTIRHEKRTQDDDLVDLRNSDEADIVKQEHLTLGPPETSDQPRPSRRRTRWSRKSTAVVARENADDSEPIQVELFSRLVRIEENLSLDNLMVCLISPTPLPTPPFLACGQSMLALLRSIPTCHLKSF